jgi:hypothetical protein
MFPFPLGKESLNPDDTAKLDQLEKKYYFYRYQYLNNYKLVSLIKFTPDQVIERTELGLRRDKHLLEVIALLTWVASLR